MEVELVKISDNTLKKLLKSAGVNRTSTMTRLVLMSHIHKFVIEVVRRAKLVAEKDKRKMITDEDILRGLNGSS